MNNQELIKTLSNKLENFCDTVKPIANFVHEKQMNSGNDELDLNEAFVSTSDPNDQVHEEKLYKALSNIRNFFTENKDSFSSLTKDINDPNIGLDSLKAKIAYSEELMPKGEDWMYINSQFRSQEAGDDDPVLGQLCKEIKSQIGKIARVRTHIPSKSTDDASPQYDR